MALEEANDAVAFEQSIFTENHGYKSFLCVVVNPYFPVLWGLDARGGRKLITLTHAHARTRTHAHTHTHTHVRTCKTTTVTLAVHGS